MTDTLVVVPAEATEEMVKYGQVASDLEGDAARTWKAMREAGQVMTADQLCERLGRATIEVLIEKAKAEIKCAVLGNRMVPLHAAEWLTSQLEGAGENEDE